MKTFADFPMDVFTYCDRDARIIYPTGEANGKLLLKTEYLNAFPGFEIAMLERGYTLCFLKHPNRWGTDAETEVMADFVKYVAEKLNIPAKCTAVGLSCGGLQAARLAQLHPELIEVLYLDAPVLNILSMAGLGAGRCEESPVFHRELWEAYGFTPSSLVCFRKSPIDAMDILIQNKIPIIMLYGDADDVVLYEENGKVLEEYYREHGGDMEIICRHGGGHHPHGLEDPTPIIAFIESRIKK